MLAYIPYMDPMGLDVPKLGIEQAEKWWNMGKDAGFRVYKTPLGWADVFCPFILLPFSWVSNNRGIPQTSPLKKEHDQKAFDFGVLCF